MAKITIDQFRGEATGVTPRLIPPGFAQSSLDADLRKRTLRGIRDREPSGIDVGLANPDTLYRYRDQLWLAFAGDIDVVRSPLADDPFKRIYWTGQGAPKMAAVDTATAGLPPYPNQSYELGVPAPDFSLTAAGSGGEQPDTVITTFYVHTYVTVYGEEGPPSLPSNSVERWDLDGAGNGWVDLSIPGVVGVGNRNITLIRIYRSEFGGDFNFVADVPAGTATYRDQVASENMLTPIESVEWDAPSENMIGLMLGPAKSMVGFFDNVICFSESNIPHAWPVRYRITVQDDIIGMAESAAGIVVATRGKPVLLVGSTPESIAPLEIDADQACVAKRSVVDMGPYVVYASPDGLVAIGPDGSKMLTDKLLELDEWRAINPYSFNAYRESDRYLAFYTDSLGNDKTLAFSPERGFEFLTGFSTAAFYDKYDDILYVANGSALDKFDRGDRKPFVWRSGIFEVQPGTSLTCAKIVADQYPLTLRVYARKNNAVELQYVLAVESTQIFRLPVAPVGPLGREWQFELAGDTEIFSAQFAQSPSEIV